MNEITDCEKMWVWGFAFGVLFSYFNITQFAIGGLVGHFLTKQHFEMLKQRITGYFN